MGVSNLNDESHNEISLLRNIYDFYWRNVDFRLAVSILKE